MSYSFPPTRAAGTQRLSGFLPRSGRDYAAGRNTDNGPDGHAHTSLLSPYLRHRLIAEREVVQAVLARHGIATAEKYIQEVLWRTYWKGWLEMRFSVWSRFLEERDHARQHYPDARAIAAAESGTTGIDGFDDWARELVATGYLHNHARMWFASIWIFTLRLPWALGADFFLRHLIDADAASNTLSWRWVAGLQTAGKVYLASADNIARYTGGRYAPKGLATEASALIEEPIATPTALAELPDRYEGKPALLLVTPEDMSPESWIASNTPIAGVAVTTASNLAWGDRSARFVAGAADDAAQRIGTHYRCSVDRLSLLDADAVIAAAQKAKLRHIVMPYAPVGPVATAMKALEPALADAGMTLQVLRRSWDSRFWPHAKKGFFVFKEAIPAELLAEGLVVR